MSLWGSCCGFFRAESANTYDGGAHGADVANGDSTSSESSWLPSWADIKNGVGSCCGAVSASIAGLCPWFGTGAKGFAKWFVAFATSIPNTVFAITGASNTKPEGFFTWDWLQSSNLGWVLASGASSLVTNTMIGALFLPSAMKVFWEIVTGQRKGAAAYLGAFLALLATLTYLGLTVQVLSSAPTAAKIGLTVLNCLITACTRLVGSVKTLDRLFGKDSKELHKLLDNIRARLGSDSKGLQIFYKLAFGIGLVSALFVVAVTTPVLSVRGFVGLQAFFELFKCDIGEWNQALRIFYGAISAMGSELYYSLVWIDLAYTLRDFLYGMYRNCQEFAKSEDCGVLAPIFKLLAKTALLSLIVISGMSAKGMVDDEIKKRMLDDWGIKDDRDGFWANSNVISFSGVNAVVSRYFNALDAEADRTELGAEADSDDEEVGASDALLKGSGRGNRLLSTVERFLLYRPSGEHSQVNSHLATAGIPTDAIPVYMSAP